MIIVTNTVEMRNLFDLALSSPNMQIELHDMNSNIKYVISRNFDLGLAYRFTSESSELKVNCIDNVFSGFDNDGNRIMLSIANTLVALYNLSL